MAKPVWHVQTIYTQSDEDTAAAINAIVANNGTIVSVIPCSCIQAINGYYAWLKVVYTI